MKQLFVSLLLLLCISCTEYESGELSSDPFIPGLKEMSVSKDVFFLKNSVRLVVSGDSSFQDLAVYWKEQLSERGISLSLMDYRGKLKRGAIHLLEEGGLEGGPEAYKIELSKRFMIVRCASKEAGFRAIQTIVQLLDLEGTNAVRTEDGYIIPGGSIYDYPEFEYRGMMLDVARHFFSVQDVKALIDELWYYKINVLHLHLSDDQGWRIEIKSWPRLAEIGGSSEVGGGEGGFYTQEEFKEIVDYATSRGVMIVPEIDMPGHTNGALASYAELNCNGKATKLYKGTRVGFSTLCVRDELTYQFVEDVVREISALCPSPYFHIGGDESHVTTHDDYVYFVNRVKKIVNAQGKQMMGWDEISAAAVGDGDVAHYWASKKNAQVAVAKGARLLLSPADYCYLDMKYDSTTVLGLTWAGYSDVSDAYNWNPLQQIDGVAKEDILGIESPLWGETIETFEDIKSLTFPRLIGHAELGWSGSKSMSLEDYLSRVIIF